MLKNDKVLYHHGNHNNDYYGGDILGYSHTHGYKSGCAGNVKQDKQDKDKEMLNILLVHWVNHNKSYKEGFREWVSKSKDMGKIETAEYIEKAMECIEKANEMLIEAKKHM